MPSRLFVFGFDRLDDVFANLMREERVLNRGAFAAQQAFPRLERLGDVVQESVGDIDSCALVDGILEQKVQK